jgi:Flp pilus assembly protein TadG
VTSLRATDWGGTTSLLAGRWPKARSGHRCRSEGGAALVEAAIILPVVLLIVFGIIEWGLAFKDALTVSSATRAGVRTASAMPRQSNMAAQTKAAVEKAVAALPNGSIQQMWIYKADPSTGYPDGGSSFSGCTTCFVYSWDTATQKFVSAGSQTWNYASQSACSGAVDSVGIYLKVNHALITGFFGNNVVLKDHTVMNLEPVPSSSGCGP